MTELFANLVLRYFINAGPAKQFFRRYVIIYLSISINMCFGAQKYRLIETVLLSTHKICFG